MKPKTSRRKKSIVKKTIKAKGGNRKCVNKGPTKQCQLEAGTKTTRERHYHADSSPYKAPEYIPEIPPPSSTPKYPNHFNPFNPPSESSSDVKPSTSTKRYYETRREVPVNTMDIKANEMLKGPYVYDLNPKYNVFDKIKDMIRGKPTIHKISAQRMPKDFVKTRLRHRSGWEKFRDFFKSYRMK
jgi:hypothetical protein